MVPRSKNELEENEFRPHLEELIIITKRLKRISAILLSVIFMSVISFAIFAVYKRILFHESYRNYFSLMAYGITFIISFVALGVFALIKFNELRKRGMILYDELTDEIDWSNKRKEFMHRPPIEMRIIVKEFVKSADLPFTSGPNGLAFYLIILLALIVSTILLFAL